jgi:serine/threonine protein phosphatase PrpC
VATVSQGCLEWASARSAARGQVESGDDACVRAFPDQVLVAVLDGLGHGAAAADVTRVGVDLIARAPNPDVLALVRECHRKLQGTRGLVMSVAMFDAPSATMTWIGIGNVSGALWSSRSRCPSTLLLRGGLLGTQLPQLKTAVVPVEAGDTLILATDGVEREIDGRLLQGPSLQSVADRVLRECGTTADDALVLVARYRGRQT